MHWEYFPDALYQIIPLSFALLSCGFASINEKHAWGGTVREMQQCVNSFECCCLHVQFFVTAHLPSFQTLSVKCKEVVFDVLSVASFHIIRIQKKLRISKRAWSKTCLWTFYNMQVSLCSIFVTIYVKKKQQSILHKCVIKVGKAL